MKIIITESQFELIMKQSINEDILDSYGEGIEKIIEYLGNLMDKMGTGKFIDKYGTLLEKLFGSISNFFKKLKKRK
jgi:dissimilatory sulfite reductase (desulfoviridin) alpha/beta subunit